jgi:hypothetical protein
MAYLRKNFDRDTLTAFCKEFTEKYKNNSSGDENQHMLEVINSFLNKLNVSLEDVGI